MEYEEQIVWQPIWLNEMHGANFKLILDKGFAKRCLEKKLSPIQQESFNLNAMKEVTSRNYKRPFLFYQDTFFINQFCLDADRWMDIENLYFGQNPLEVKSDKIIYCSKNFDTFSDREETLKLIDYWISHVHFF